MTTTQRKQIQWHSRRQLTPTPDGQRRWDRAYQSLLLWSQLNLLAPTLTTLVQDQTPIPPTCPQPDQEVQDDQSSSPVRSGFDPQPG